jgi:hypothetical protein
MVPGQGSRMASMISSSAAVMIGVACSAGSACVETGTRQGHDGTQPQSNPTGQHENVKTGDIAHTHWCRPRNQSADTITPDGFCQHGTLKANHVSVVTQWTSTNRPLPRIAAKALPTPTQGAACSSLLHHTFF